MFHGSAECGDTLREVQGAEHYFLTPVALVGIGKCGLHKHVVEPAHLILCAGLKRPYSLRYPYISSDDSARKLKILELISRSGWQQR